MSAVESRGESASGGDPAENFHSVSLVIPFADAKHCTIVQRSLQADPEPVRSHCVKSIEADDTSLRVKISAKDIKNLRNATTNFFELLDLVLKTIEEFAP
ncbi:uncharacterized protein LOC100902185 [Galendromus occidentalis]|uniref:L antigen family member 3 n=1 Tax=Galendromus occidentalis TaxID=34638 RepID=A0AAJ6VZX4_9ACAR|nr:uncharacterized protein LOC100902185 [Galendromus occidentalis]